MKQAQHVHNIHPTLHEMFSNWRIASDRRVLVLGQTNNSYSV